MKKPTEKKKERSVLEKRNIKVTYSSKPSTVMMWRGKWEEVAIR
jgi:hypothetical protein